MNFCIHSIQKKHIFYFGFLVLLLSYIPMLLLGTDTIVPYHDQLDGELIAYIYQAKYLFSGQNVIPEFLNGAAKTALTAPAPLAILFFRLFSPFTAYMILLVLGQTFAYAGMFLLTDTIVQNQYIAFITAILYAFLPFLPVYGLSQYGIPMLLVCFINIYHKHHNTVSFLFIALYTAMSSLVLCGFTWLIALCIFFLYLVFSKKLKRHLNFFAVYGIMFSIYILENQSLVQQILTSSENYVSHKEEYVLAKSDFISSFINYLKNNDSHSSDNHIYILYAVLVAVPVILLTYKHWSRKAHEQLRLLLSLLALLCVMCSIAALWQTSLFIQLREALGSLGAFQLSRLLWSAPTLWYLIMALCLSILCSNRTFIKWGYYAFSTLLICILSFCCLKTSYVKPCVQELIQPEYETISWSDYLALGVMDQVESYINEQESLEIHEYKVASLGIDPAAALYHGFYCVDGYSNNYDLDYKHKFRAVIAPELARNDYLTGYYDTWGNRCYLFSAEIPGYFNIQKGTFWYNDLQLDTAALKELGCDYILSAAYVVNAEELNMTLLREDAFETADSYYRIYIYKLA